MELAITTVGYQQLDWLVKSADIVCTATSTPAGCGPVFQDSDCHEWLHINAVGADFPGKTEVPLSLLRRSVVCPDFIEQATKEGECQQLTLAEIGPSLVNLVQNGDQYLDLPEQLTVFDSTGWALEDLVALEMVMDYANELDLGHEMILEGFSQDPRDPYAFLSY